MFHVLIVLIAVTDFSFASDSNQDTSTYNNIGKNNKLSQGALSFYAALNNNPAPLNITFFEKDENQVRIPTKIYDEHKKKKKIKKSPKRTIQKIIKKGKSRSRKIYVHPVTRQPTAPSPKVDMVDIVSNENEDVTTTSPRKRLRKNLKVARNPMPFHRLQSRKDHNRNRRQIDDRDDLFILKDLDEVEFLDKGKDYDVVKAHVQSYW